MPKITNPMVTTPEPEPEPKCEGEDRGHHCTNPAQVRIQYHDNYFGEPEGPEFENLCLLHLRMLYDIFGWTDEDKLSWSPPVTDVYHIIRVY